MVLIMSYELYYETHVCLLKLFVPQSRIYIFVYIYELFINEVVSEVSKEMRSDSPFKLLDFEELPKSNTTPRWNSKGVFAPIVSRTLVKIKCLANSLMEAYNWLTELNIIPPNLIKLSQEQLKKHVNDLYISDNKELFSLYFCA